jgi:hypothetical protein
VKDQDFDEFLESGPGDTLVSGPSDSRAPLGIPPVWWRRLLVVIVVLLLCAAALTVWLVNRPAPQVPEQLPPSVPLAVSVLRGFQVFGDPARHLGRYGFSLVNGHDQVIDVRYVPDGLPPGISVPVAAPAVAVSIAAHGQAALTLQFRVNCSEAKPSSAAFPIRLLLRLRGDTKWVVQQVMPNGPGSEDQWYAQIVNFVCMPSGA